MSTPHDTTQVTRLSRRARPDAATPPRPPSRAVHPPLTACDLGPGRVPILAWFGVANDNAHRRSSP